MSDKAPYITSSSFPSDQIMHGFFGRQGGISAGLYNSLNVGYSCMDEQTNVNENRRRILDSLGADNELLVAKQVHSDKCLYVDGIDSDISAVEADALVTDIPSVPLGILTADCVPVLFFARKENGEPVIGVAHAGWRGAIGGILQSTIKTMTEKGVSNVSDIQAVIGPCIGAVSYEVSDDFMDEFIDQAQANENFFVPSDKEGHKMFDIAGYVRSQLNQAGVKSVEHLAKDTYALDDIYFSHRKACHEGLVETGRQASVIMIR